MSVKKVPEDRWRAAQAWELDVWKQNCENGDDWNNWWFQKFDKYQALPNKIDRMIELGCGPFTNARLIVKDRAISMLVCSDPLASEYIKLSPTWLAQAYGNHSILIDNNPIETCPQLPGSFDAVIMINVLDHVQDADVCMQKAVGLVKPSGYIVIGQDLSNDDDIKKYPDDLGHPIRLTLEDLELHLVGFASVLKKVLPRGEGRNPDAHYGTLVYIGKKPDITAALDETNAMYDNMLRRLANR